MCLAEEITLTKPNGLLPKVARQLALALSLTLIKETNYPNVNNLIHKYL